MDKIKVSQQQRDNAIEARDRMWPTVPKRNIAPDLGYWRRDSEGNMSDQVDCGTVACFGGWCALWPAFQAQGIRSTFAGAPRFDGAEYSFATEVSEKLFGDRSIFRSRGSHPADREYNQDDHALVLRRLNWLINHSEVVS